MTSLPKSADPPFAAGGGLAAPPFVGEDPYENPMRVFPAVHYSMGGLWVDYEADAKNDMVKDSPRQQATNIPGIKVIEEKV